MKFSATRFSGVFVLEPFRHQDHRGHFSKLLRAPDLEAAGLESNFPETFVTWSSRNVLRGLHFQAPPHGHAKLVSCLAGSVLDVILDLRPDSPTCGESLPFHLGGDRSPVLYLPDGIAHGFLALEDGSCMHYQTSTVNVPSHDTGIRWDSFGFEWPVETPILSDRDRALPPWRNT
ncbi:MAG: dTDP-4-dehydrorhamnose 3,5-epimerase family protein [Fibrobacteres bacterium]|jgi:dTDP-4-dehydrorhamnose 3,5-epimerase|nr:dTDP-4-dehydrorhamnose 3,5-epimerase family protein [Fibrobacterota bacterium]